MVSEPYRVEVEVHPNAHNAIHYAVICERMMKRTTKNIEEVLLCSYRRTIRYHRKRSASEEGGSQPPQTSKRKTIKVSENDSATINCNVNRLDRDGNQVTVRWKKDGKVIRQSILNKQNEDTLNANPIETPLFRDDGRINMDSKNGSITILSTIPSDAGIYEVVQSFIETFKIFTKNYFKQNKRS